MAPQLPSLERTQQLGEKGLGCQEGPPPADLSGHRSLAGFNSEWAMRWAGLVRIPVAGISTFYVTVATITYAPPPAPNSLTPARSQERIRLWVDNKNLVNQVFFFWNCLDSFVPLLNLGAVDFDGQ